jgi:opacity protein-like surface antigen
MIGGVMLNRFTIGASIVVALASFDATSAYAQAKPRTPAAAARRPAPKPARSISIGGYAMFGTISFTAKQSFDAILGSASGPIAGGGARVGLPWGGLFVDIGAFRYSASGERVLIANTQTFKLGIPVDVTVTPIELSAGWRFRFRRAPKITPYIAGGFTTLKYQETSTFATTSEDADESFNGYHVIGGAEYKIMRWLGVAGEGSWSTVPDAIGETGVSKAFNETDLGGKTFRFKITIGR